MIESRENALSTAARLAEIAQSLGLLVIYKSSFDKGNRSSGNSYRGPGLEEGLRILDDVRQETGLPLLTDVHTPEQAILAADVVDVLQTPAFLCRQTDLIVAAVKTGCPVNIKKGQFMAPQEMRGVAAKAKAAGCLIWEPRQEPYPVGYYCGVRDPDGNAVEFSYGQPLGPGAEPMK